MGTLNTTFSLQTSWLCPRTQLTKAFCKLSRTTYGHTSTSRNRGSALSPHSTVDHSIKHYKFWVVLEDQKTPISCEEINWAKNWLAQHIKNTDQQYKKRLIGPDTGDNFTGSHP